MRLYQLGRWRLDNALRASIIGLHKTALVDRQRSCTAPAGLERETAVWVHGLNTHRLHSSIGYRPPVELGELHRDITSTQTLEVA